MTSSHPSRVGVLILALIASTLPALAQTAGDLALIGWDDAADNFTFVALSDIPSGKTFYFTDNGWTGTAFRGVTATNNGGSEGVCRLVTNATIPMGTIISNTSTGPSFTWTFSGPITGGGNYSALALTNADQIYIFTNTATTDPVFSTASMTHIFLLDDTGTFENAAGQFTGNITPGLTLGSTALTFDHFGETDRFMSFNAPPCLMANGGSKAQWLAAIANSANWTFGTTGTQPSGTLNVVGTTPAEICDGIDNNCDGQTDEGFPGLAIASPPGFAITCLPAPAPSFTGGLATGCPPPTVTSSDGPLVGGPCGGTITRTWTATNASGSVNSAQTITVNDTTPPSITCPGPVSVQCFSLVPAPNPGSVTASDDCGGAVTVIHVGDSASNGTGSCNNVVTRTYQATDVCGNFATCTQTITVNDTTPPSITCPGPVSVQCFSLVPAPNTGSVTASDNCGGAVTVIHMGDSASNGTGSCNNVVTRIYKATDVCGNFATCTQTITVNDTTPPSITCPGPVSVQCFSLVPAPNTGSVTASDNCGGAVTVIHVGDSASNGTASCNNVVTRTYKATDVCGNFATCTQTITVNDTTPPSITCPGPSSVQCFSLLPAPNTGSVTASDNCGGAVTVIHVGDSASNGTGSCNNVVTRTYQATDACGNFATCTQTITVNDTTPPSITCPGPSSVQCFSLVPTPDTGTVTASDNCGGAVTVIHVGDSASNGTGSCNNVVTRTYQATDACGNFATCTQTITVNDTTPPSIACAGPSSVQCFSLVPTPDTGTVTASDCGGAVTVIHLGDSASNGTASCNNVVTRTYQATDACGNFATCTQTITVNDTTPPSIACAGPVSVQCFSLLPAPNTGSVTASDDCGGAVTVIHLGDSATNGGASCNNVVTRTYQATDVCGNFATCTQIITVNDTVAPAISCPPAFTVPCSSPFNPLVTGTATATDGCNPAPVVTYSDSISGSCPSGATITRTWIATDGCNSATCQQTITLSPGQGQGCVAGTVTDLGGECGAPAPFLTSSPPVIGEYLAIFITSGAPSSQIILTAQGPPAPPPTPLGSGCVLYNDPLTALILDSFSTDASGAWQISQLIAASPALIGLQLNLQAGILFPGGPIGFAQLTNGLTLSFGSCPPFCTAAADVYAGNGYPGQVLDFNYASIFATGLEIGVFDLSGGNAPPNGLRWDATPAGLMALESFLAGAPAPSGPLVADALNPTTAPGAGSLAVQTAALQINIALNDAGVLGSALSGYSALIYSNHPGIPDSLNGLTVTQLLAVANQALAGLGLPAGYSYDSLAVLIEDLNLSYHGCVETLFGSRFLFHPVY